MYKTYRDIYDAILERLGGAQDYSIPDIHEIAYLTTSKTYYPDGSSHYVFIVGRSEFLEICEKYRIKGQTNHDNGI